VIRSPRSVRPWQHVLEPLSGYLALAERLWTDPELKFMEWNFGPPETSARSVEWIVNFLCSRFKNAQYRIAGQPSDFHEAGTLQLDSSRAHSLLHWKARWDLSEALDRTIAWHLEWQRGGDMQAITSSQISAYEGTSRREC
jgi:CDP-glucose 4,6-dehydratase